MVKKSLINYICSNCGATYPAWSGRCPSCGEWNTLQEEAVITISGSGSSKRDIGKIHSLDNSITKDDHRIKTGMRDVDLVLGGGLVEGSISLLAGQPGIGKSTLLMQIANGLSSNSKVLYVSGEESAHQIGMRAQRMKLNKSDVSLAISNSADEIANTINNGQYKVVIIDSIQTISVDGVSSSPGSVSQITNSNFLLSNAAKRNNTAVIYVGHVTKEGAIAGPKVLEHSVDAVLQLEGDRFGGFKLLRSVKNRYGPTNETGIFEMDEKGLSEVLNPSEALLAERKISDGSVVLATMEGSRPLLVEVQALVNRTPFGYPKRTASGFDLNRLNLLLAMLEKRTKLSLVDQDVYINVVGGIKVGEPAGDLAVCMAIASAAKGMQLKKNAVVFGEVGLSGEIRHVPYGESRALEAKKLGFEVAIGPKYKAKKSLPFLHQVQDVRTALNQFLEL